MGLGLDPIFKPKLGPWAKGMAIYVFIYPTYSCIYDTCARTPNNVSFSPCEIHPGNIWGYWGYC